MDFAGKDDKINFNHNQISN